MNEDTAQHGKLDLRRDAETNVLTVTCECGASETFGDSADVAYKWWLSHLATLPPRSWPTPVPRPPEVSAAADAAVLAGVLDAINTYDQVIFTDQHRALFERAATQPAPEVPAGARAAGSWVNPDVSYRKLLEVVRQVAASFDVGADEDAIDCIADAAMTAAEADRKVCCPDCLQWSWHGPDAERKVIDHYLKVHAAPPTPSAHGVAELLAECEKRKAQFPNFPLMDCDEIVRLLTPDGADGEGKSRG